MLNGCYRHNIIAIPLPIWAYSYYIYDKWKYIKIIQNKSEKLRAETCKDKLGYIEIGADEPI